MARSSCRINPMSDLTTDTGSSAGRIHPAAEWARDTTLTSSDVDCTTAVVLKILDNKCKMLVGEKNAIIEVYYVVKELKCNLFTETDHNFISKSCMLIHQQRKLSSGTVNRIHELRVYAEANIEKPIMKEYKKKLRHGLFG